VLGVLIEDARVRVMGKGGFRLRPASAEETLTATSLSTKMQKRIYLGVPWKRETTAVDGVSLLGLVVVVGSG
jgi:hypothetical protein